MYSSDFTGVGSHSSIPLLCATDETSQTNGSATCPDISSANTPPCSNPDASSPSTQVMEITVKQEEEEEHCERPLKMLRTDTEPSSEASVPHNNTETVWPTSRNPELLTSDEGLIQALFLSVKVVCVNFRDANEAHFCRLTLMPLSSVHISNTHDRLSCQTVNSVALFINIG